jgi:hypothetical protein
LAFALSFLLTYNHNISVLASHPGDPLARWQPAHRIALFANFLQLFKQVGWTFIADRSDGLIMLVRQPPIYKKQLSVFLQIFNILRKKGEINFKIGGLD